MSEPRHPRKIIHIDMDCFYAAIEIRDNPELRGRPVAVGGDPGRRGVLTTCSYEARKFGVRSAMASARALKLCPGLIILPVHMDKYKAASKSIHEVFHEFTERIEPLSLDEAYLDVSDADHCQGSATLMAREIRRRIFEKESLSASAGIAPNKFLAKIASDWNKPNGQFVITPADIPDFIRTLPVHKIFGVGKVTAAKMQRLDIHTCADLQALGLEALVIHFGRFGHTLHALCRGIDEREVQTERERKSLSVERTFHEDLPTLEAMTTHLPGLFEELSRRLGRTRDKSEQDIKNLFVKLKFDDFTQTTMQHPHPALSSEIYRQLLGEAWTRRHRPVRLIGLGVQFQEGAVEASATQLDLGFS